MNRYVKLVCLVFFVVVLSACGSSVERSDRNSSSDNIPYNEFGMYVDSELKVDILNTSEYPFKKVDNQENSYYLIFSDVMETKRGIKINDTIDNIASQYNDVTFNVIMSDSSYEKVQCKKLVTFSENHDITLISYSNHVLDGKIIDYFGNKEKYSGKEIVAYVLSFNIESNNITGISLLNEKFIAE